MSFGVVEGSVADGEDRGLTVAEIEGHPFGQITFTGERWALADVRLLSPILPSKVVCVGRNYADHAKEMGNEVPAEPLLFLKPSTSVIGHRDVVRLPPQSKRVEHEAELAVIIGAPGARRIDRADAAKSIFGYTCANDVTARDLQRADVQFTRGKGFDSFCPLGPWIVTDFDPSDVEVRCEVNEEVRQLGAHQGHDLRCGHPGVVRLTRDDAAAGRRGADRYAGRCEPDGDRGHRHGAYRGPRRTGQPGGRPGVT
jgi:2-keto-4-pentenoate hydratase/2-oxohepta-3-ene-1,7-dioic acid hydratase in catechol pathway